MQPRFPVQGNKALKPLNIPMWVVVVGETPSLTGKFIGEPHVVLECTQTHPPGNQQQKVPIFLWVAKEVTESWVRAKKVALFLI